MAIKDAVRRLISDIPSNQQGEAEAICKEIAESDRQFCEQERRIADSIRKCFATTEH